MIDLMTEGLTTGLKALPQAIERSEVCPGHGLVPVKPVPPWQDGRSGRVSLGAVSIDTPERSENAGLD